MVTTAAATAFQMVLRHMGALHPFETALVFLIAFGPFVVIGLLVRRERRRAVAEEHQAIGHVEEPVGGDPG
jgi:hypothetical protein